MNENLKYFQYYNNNILIPSIKKFNEKLDNNVLNLFEVIQFNILLSHTVDYMGKALNSLKNEDLENILLENNYENLEESLLITDEIYSYILMPEQEDIIKKYNENIINKKEISRSSLIDIFDIKYDIYNPNFVNMFKIVDAITNSVKHIELDTNRYKKLYECFKQFNIYNLKEYKKNNEIYIIFKTENTFFDYSRVILRPIYSIFKELENDKEVYEFLLGISFGCSDYNNFSDEDDDIDKMISLYHPICLNCGEDEKSICEESLIKNNQMIQETSFNNEEFNRIGESLFNDWNN